MPGAFHAAGDILTPVGAVCAYGDRNPAPVRVERPRPERLAPGRAECPRL